jgi:ABC-type glutathione transport system ATPase component
MATPTIMITVAGKAGSGKSTIAYQIKRLLMGYGFPVEHQERELCSHAVFKRMNNPLDILLAMKQRGTKIIINEQQLNLSARPPPRISVPRSELPKPLPDHPRPGIWSGIACNGPP